MSKTNASQQFLDEQQYARKSILRYERIFGHTWVSTGGEKTVREFSMQIEPKNEDRMLDVGCGTGGSACFFARYYGVSVEGVDLSANMISIASERLVREDIAVQKRVKYILADIMKSEYPENHFDIIYSRDTILHIAEKEVLMAKLYKWLKPGGKLFITDYCRGVQKHSEVFKNYVAQRGYDLRSVEEYGKVIANVGFKNVKAIDGRLMFENILTEELEFFKTTKKGFINDFSETDYNDIESGWQSKIGRVKSGDQTWGIFHAQK